jgi:predicted phage baseplate assembly protein
LGQLSVPGQSTVIFPNPPEPEDAFYLAFEKDQSHHVLALVMNVEGAGGRGVDPLNPPIEWQVWQGGEYQWVKCEIEYDGTKGFNYDGELILHAPKMEAGEFQGVQGYWLRCIPTSAQANEKNHYSVSPEIESLHVEARSAIIAARHAITVENELLGYSDGSSGQTFKLLHTPILEPAADKTDGTPDCLIVEPPDKPSERWREVEDFGDSTPDARHYLLDRMDGALTLGPTLIQPDGKAYRFGATPPKSSRLLFSRYQYGGGVIGNVAARAISVLKSSIPYVARVTNHKPAVGGLDAQSLEDAKLRAAQYLRARRRAVTADDFEYHATQVPGIARALCLAPEDLPGDPQSPKPGRVFIIPLPEFTGSSLQLTPEDLVFPDDLRERLSSDLRERCVLGIGVEIQEPNFTWVSVRAKLRLPERKESFWPTEAVNRAKSQF